VLRRIGSLLTASLDSMRGRQRAVVRFNIPNPDKPLILIPVSVSGRGPYTFVLDTGASLTLLSPALEAELGLVAGTEADGVGAGGALRVALYTVTDMSVAAQRLRDVEVAVYDLSSVENAVGRSLDGILGYNFLSHFAVTIDYQQQIVTFRRART
jgi:predicted aspartyl protease